ncbi:hypothetical protein Tco_1469921 [Tanacetum coccineum]
MSSDNALSAVTYTSISSDSNGPSWGIPLVNVGEIMEMDHYEEHAPIYVPEPEHLEYHVPSDDDILVEDQPYADDASMTAESPGYIADLDLMEEGSIDYLDEPEDDDDDPEEDPSEEHKPEDDDKDPEEDPSKEHKPEDDDEDPEEDPSEEHEPEDEDTKEEEPSEGSDEIEPFKKDEIAALIDAFAAGSPSLPLPPTSPAYDLAPLGHKATMIRMRDDIPEDDMPPRKRFVLIAPPHGCDVAESSAARPPRGQYDFVDTVEVGQGLIRSPGHDARTIARAIDRAEDVGYVRDLQASEHRMMTSIKEVNLRVSYQAQVHKRDSKDFYTQLHDARTDRIDIRLEIDVNKALLARLETLETHMSRMEWQRQGAEDFAVRQMMRTQVLEARARIDTVEDPSISC